MNLEHFVKVLDSSFLQMTANMNYLLRGLALMWIDDRLGNAKINTNMIFEIEIGIGTARLPCWMDFNSSVSEKRK